MQLSRQGTRSGEQGPKCGLSPFTRELSSGPFCIFPFLLAAAVRVGVVGADVAGLGAGSPLLPCPKGSPKSCAG